MNAASMAAGIWLIYLALEPFARRRWPEMLISWSRAISGRLRDPLVGRDVLIGAAVGTSAGLILGPGRVLLPPLFHLPAPPPHDFGVDGPASPTLTLAWTLSTLMLSVIWILGIVFFLVLARMVVRKGWLAGVVVTALFVASYLGQAPAAITLPLAALSVGLIVGMTVRFGLLAAVTAEFCRRVCGYRLFTSDPSSWYFYATVIVVVGLVALAYWASRTALAGQPLFGELAFEEKPVPG